MVHILIADDEPLQRLLIHEMLADDPSFTFTEAEDGLQALEKARRARPDVIILDVMMPAMDGLAVCQALRADQDLRCIPVIFTTAFPDKIEDAIRCSADSTELIRKPFEESQLKAAVDKLFRRSATVGLRQ